MVNIMEMEQIIKNAEGMERMGIDAKDALHIACAVEGKAELFFTTDNDIIRRSDNIREIRILNPVHFFTDMEKGG